MRTYRPSLIEQHEYLLGKNVRALCTRRVLSDRYVAVTSGVSQ